MIYLDFLLNAYTNYLTMYKQDTQENKTTIFNEIKLTIQEYDAISSINKVNYIEQLNNIKKLYDKE